LQQKTLLIIEKVSGKKILKAKCFALFIFLAGQTRHLSTVEDLGKFQIILQIPLFKSLYGKNIVVNTLKLIRNLIDHYS